jgi:dolichol kinase
MLLEFVIGFSVLLGYFTVCAAGALVLRRFIAIPAEIFRKTLHFILVGSVFIWTYAFKTWWISAAAAVALVVIVYPILLLAERVQGYSELLIERRHGEIKKSLVVVFIMFAVLICVCWGWFGERYLVVASVFAWGLGDGAAALIGKHFGKHYIEGKLIEGRKSLEGTLAMFAVSFVSVIAVLLLNGSVAWYVAAPIAAVTAAACAIVELYTKGGMDTLTCPFAAAFIMIPLIRLLGV